MLAETLAVLFIGAGMSVLILGLERKIHARIQRRCGPSVSMPGLWSMLKFMYKEPARIDSPNPGFYGLLLVAATASILSVLAFSTPPWYGILGFSSLLGLVGLLKVEEVAYVFMGSLSRSVMSAGMPYPDLIRGSKGAGIRYFFEDVAATRALKMITLGSFPFYVAMAVPFAAAKSLEIAAVTRAPPTLYTVYGLLSAFVYFIGYNIIANNRPFDIIKPKVDIIEGPMMEYAQAWRALSYLMRGLVLFTLSSVFVTLYLGIPLDVTDANATALHLILAMALPVLASVLRAFSPVLTFRQIYPISLASTLLGILCLALGAGGA